jgi:hypothetical protein
MKLKLQIALSIALLPVVFCLFILDRIILVFLPWMPSQAVYKWFHTPQDVQQSLFRVIGVGLAYSLYLLISLFF